jgi:hypothetical protein
VDWLLEGIGRMSDALGYTSAFVGTTITAGAANTKGSYAATPLSTSTPHDAQGVMIFNTTRSATAADYLVDIALGASGSERIVIPNLLWSEGSSSGRLRSYFFPLNIPAGSRLNARCQSSTASATIAIGAAIVQASFSEFTSFDRFVEFGAVTASTAGTVLTNPAAAGWGAWTLLSASVPDDLRWFMLAAGDNKVTTRTTAQMHAWQAGVGAAAAESPFTLPKMCGTSSTSLGLSLQTGFPYNVSAGQRLSARYGSSATTNLGLAAIAYGGVV